MTRILATLALAIALLGACDLHDAEYPSTPHVYEDGSFVLGPVAGCIPLTYCS